MFLSGFFKAFKAGLQGIEADARRSFKDADTDRSGMLDHEEMRELAKSFGVEDEVELDEAIEEMDTDLDGEISLQEYMVWFRASLAGKEKTHFFKKMVTSLEKTRMYMSGDSQDDIEKKPKIRNADARKAFLAADVDGNGYLDHDEVRSLAISLGATDERKLQEAIADMDKDVNNEIDLQEFMRWWRRKDDMISSTDSGGFFGRLKKVTNQHGNAENLKADLEHRRRDSDESLSDEDRELDTNGMLRSKDSLDFEDDSEAEEDIEEEWWYDTSEEEDDEGEKEEEEEEEIDDTPRVSFDAFQKWLDNAVEESAEQIEKVKQMDWLHRGLQHLEREDIIGVLEMGQCIVDETEAVPLSHSKKREPHFSINKLDSYWDTSASGNIRAYTFVCDSEEEKEKWFRCLELNVEYNKEFDRLSEVEQAAADTMETSRTVVDELEIVSEAPPEVRFRFFQVHDARAAQIAAGEHEVEGGGLGDQVFGMTAEEEERILAMAAEGSRFKIDDISCGVFGPESKVRQLCVLMSTSELKIPIPKIWTCGKKGMQFGWISVGLSSAMLVVVCGNAIVIAAEGPDVFFTAKGAATQLMLKTADLFCLVCFLFESVVKIIANGFLLTPNAYLMDSWQRLDFFVVCVSVFDVLVNAVGLDVGQELLGALKLLRILRPLKLLNMIPSMSVVLDSIIAAIPAATGIITLVILSFVIFGIFGVTALCGKFYRCHDASGKPLAYGQNFRPDPINPDKGIMDRSGIEHWGYDRAVCDDPNLCNGDLIPPYIGTYPTPCQWKNPQFHFDDIGAAMKTLFSVWTIGGWAEIMQASMDVVDIDMAPVRDNMAYMGVYYLVFVIFVGYMLRSLFIAVLVDFFAQNSGSALTTKTQKNWQQMIMITSRMQPRRGPPKHSCFCISLETRLYCYKLTNRKDFVNAINATIIIGMAIMLLPLKLWPDYVSGWFYEIQRLTLLIWTLEMFGKMIALGPCSARLLHCRILIGVPVSRPAMILWH